MSTKSGLRGAPFVLFVLWLLTTVSLLAACSQSTASPEPPTPVASPPSISPTPASILDDTTWVLNSLNGQSPIQGTRITLNFSNGFVGGFAGCNNYRSLITGTDVHLYRYTTTPDGKLDIPAFLITEKDCPTPPGVMQQEQAYVQALQAATAFRLFKDRLELDNAAGDTSLVFDRQWP